MAPPEDKEKDKTQCPGSTSKLTLYDLALKQVSSYFREACYDQEFIPPYILLDIYIKVVENGTLDDVIAVKEEACKLNVFLKLLQHEALTNQLHNFVKNIVNREIKECIDSDLFQSSQSSDPNVYRLLVLDLLPARLATNFDKKVLNEIKNQDLRDNLIKIGILLGDFLCQAGWFEEGAKVLNQCTYVCLAEDELEGYKKSVPCLGRLLSAQVSYSLHSQARVTYDTAILVIKKLQDAAVEVNLSGLYAAFSGLCYLECSYSESLDWSIKALNELKKALHCTEARTIVDILRQAAKSCHVKREFHKAELLIKEAVYLARDVYGSNSVKYADALLDYGYYLVNRDSVNQSVTVYRECLQIRKAAFGQYNFMTAIATEDLAYALYVMEYNTGNFDEARRLSESAISVMTILLKANHLQFASVKRVKALILEEIAIDMIGAPSELELLKEAETLHLDALKLSKQVFGEMNIQIAKHYGNLGRLYQSMKKFLEAESMHLKAIKIKETLLGLYDYEVALSVGHLASLYNYDMEEYRKAEELHLRSINIGKRLFGDAYSGLEYDYRGLLQIYTLEGNQTKLSEYSRIITQWQMLRDLALRSRGKAISDSQFSQPVSTVLEDFFSMEWINLERS